MKKTIYSFIFISLFLPSLAFAGACPVLKSDIESKISELDEKSMKLLLMLH